MKFNKNGFLLLSEVIFILLILAMLSKLFILFYNNQKKERQLMSLETNFEKTVRHMNMGIEPEKLVRYKKIKDLYVYTKDLYKLNCPIFVLNNPKKYIKEFENKDVGSKLWVTIDSNIPHLLKNKPFSLESIKLHDTIKA